MGPTEKQSSISAPLEGGLQRSLGSAEELLPGVFYWPSFWPEQMALFEHLRDNVPWDRSMRARLTASFGVPYNYVQMVYPEAPFLEALKPVRRSLEQHLGVRFNNCLINYYLDGRNKMGFHADDTTELVPETGVAIVSVGHCRTLSFRSQSDPENRHNISLEAGSLLWMKPEVQSEWVHAIKRRKFALPRMSLTWRAFVSD